MLKAGIHPKIVSERLRHAKIGITLDTYSHVLPGHRRELFSALMSLTGFASASETLIWDGVRLFQDWINGKGGTGNRHLKIRTYGSAKERGYRVWLDL